jgi:prolyl-tRNA synthetase
MKGVPVRIELGPKDLEQGAVTIARRDTGTKESGITWANLAAKMKDTLEDIQKNLLVKAKQERDQRIVKALKWEDFITALDGKNMVLTPWCDEAEAEVAVKRKAKSIYEARKAEEVEAEKKKKATKDRKKKKKNEKEQTDESDKKSESEKGVGEEAAEDFEQLSSAPKTLCIPFEQPELPVGTKCFFTEKEAKCWVLWGRSY